MYRIYVEGRLTERLAVAFTGIRVGDQAETRRLRG